jgi:hypothetical protein
MDLSLLSTALPYVAIAAAAYFGTKLLKKGDDRVEQRRLGALAVAGVLRGKGFTSIPRALETYAVGDYSGFAAYLHSLASVLTNPDSADSEFEAVFDKALLSKLNEPAKRKALLDRIAAITGENK